MKTNTLESVRAYIYENQTSVLRDYLTASCGERIGFYIKEEKLIHHVGQSIGDEICEEERPLLCVECPGINNLDSSCYTADFCSWSEEREAYVVDGPFMADQGRVVGRLADVIRECCEDGDMSKDLEDFLSSLNLGG